MRIVRKPLSRRGLKKPLKERSSIKSQIESWPGIKRKEMAWGKNYGGDLVPVAKEENRKANAVKTEFKKRVFNYFDYDYHVHTHPRGSALISPKDLLTQARVWKSSKKPTTDVISVLNKKGKETGRIHVKMSNRAAKEIINYFEREGSAAKKLDSAKKIFKWKLLLDAWEKLHDLRIRFVAMPGYRFDYAKDKFVKKEN